MKTENMKNEIYYHVVKEKDYKKVLLPGLAEWAKALRSGEFEQGRDQLCYEGRYCCLGVLSKLQGRLGIIADEGFDGEPRWVGTLSLTNPLYDVIGESGRLPEGVYVIINEQDLDLEAMREDKDTEWLTLLTELNDKGLSFEQIADILEELYTEN